MGSRVGLEPRKPDDIQRCQPEQDNDHPTNASQGVFVLTEELAEKADVEYILDATNFSFPGARLTADDVISTWVGVRPLIRPSGEASPSAVSRDYALFHSPSGLVTVGGGKLTAFRAMASHILDDLFPATRRMLELADEHVQLGVEARCWCGERATHNARLVNGVLTREGETVVIGDTVPSAEAPLFGDVVTYELLCRRHYRAGLVGPT